MYFGEIDPIMQEFRLGQAYTRKVGPGHFSPRLTTAQFCSLCRLKLFLFG
jgi:hypothetical protein